ncbi:T9SS type A sorting domain-containing protein [Psychroserpens damuponensis]|uniref:T9SS type A sorting domain-containing protein n=1 Tax=Psychroserpens damuponensis TaxID=943936 RepID=UPI00069400A7|nr:T9SS type A sorting domain-containing protein [Psychroserpens damuponensis]
MKQKLLSFLTLIGACTSIFAQTTFEPKVTIDANTGNNPYTIATGLIDADPFLDIIIGTDADHVIVWYKGNGDGTFVKQTPITNTLTNVGSVKLVDINGDGFQDVLASGFGSYVTATYGQNSKLVWYANDGAGNFATEQLITDAYDGLSGSFVGNIDSDSHLDIAVTSSVNNQVLWFSGDGAGNFGSPNIIDNTLSSPGVVNMKDIDGDGDLDAIVATAAYSGDVIEIFRNDLIPGGTVAFIKDATSVTTGKNGIFNATFEDLDGDANLDILVSEVSYGGGPTGNFYWYEDDGAGGYTETTFVTSLVNPAFAQHQDLDNDGLKDIILSSGTSGAGNDIVWFKNNGGTYGTEQVIDDTSSQAFIFDVADYDADGDLDIASCAYNQDDLNYLENLKVTKTNALVLTGVFDGSLSGGLPKGVEIFVLQDIPDLSVFGLGSANNGGGSDGLEFSFPAVAATTGQFIYVSSESTQFSAFFGQSTDYADNAMNINGDDAIELFENGVVIDTYGDINTNGDGEVWDYTDGWAYRVVATGPDGVVFVPGNWNFSGIDELEGGTNNATASTPFPIGTYSSTLSIDFIDSNNFIIYPNPATDKLTFAGNFNNVLDISVYNALGQVVLSNKITSGDHVDVSQLNNGIYFIKDNNSNFTRKFIKQ